MASRGRGAQDAGGLVCPNLADPHPMAWRCASREYEAPNESASGVVQRQARADVRAGRSAGDDSGRQQGTPDPRRLADARQSRRPTARRLTNGEGGRPTARWPTNGEVSLWRSPGKRPSPSSCGARLVIHRGRRADRSGGPAVARRGHSMEPAGTWPLPAAARMACRRRAIDDLAAGDRSSQGTAPSDPCPGDRCPGAPRVSVRKRATGATPPHARPDRALSAGQAPCSCAAARVGRNRIHATRITEHASWLPESGHTNASWQTP